MSRKQCQKCHTEKPLTDFNRNKNNPDGRWHYCKECRRNWPSYPKPRKTKLYRDERTRECGKCRKILPNSEFSTDGRGGLGRTCRACNGKILIARRYSMSFEEYNSFVAARGNCSRFAAQNQMEKGFALTMIIHVVPVCRLAVSVCVACCAKTVIFFSEFLRRIMWISKKWRGI